MARAGGLFIDIAMNVAQIQKDARKSSEALSAFQKSAERVGNALQTAFKVGAVGASIYGTAKSIAGLTESLKDLADRGERAGDLAAGFERLGGSSASIEQARERTLGLVNSFELMRIASRGMTAEVPGFEKGFAQVAELGARLADTWGLDTTQAIEKVTQAIITGKKGALEQIGFVINTKKAYDDYAKSLGVVASQLTETEKKHALQTQAMSQRVEVMERLAPVTDSVSTALASLGNSWDEVADKAGIAFNENTSLTQSLRDLEKVIRTLDLKEFAGNVADLAAAFVSMANTALPPVIDWLNKLALTIGAVREARDQLNVNTGNPLIDYSMAFGYAAGNTNAVVKGMTEDKAQSAMARINEGQAKLAASGKDLFAYLDKAAPKAESVARAMGGDRGISPEAKRAADEVRRLTQEVGKLESSQVEKSLESQIEDAIGNLDQTTFAKLTEQFQEHTAKGVLKGLEDAVSKGVISAEKAQQLASTAGMQSIEKMNDAMAKAVEDRAEKERKAIEDNAEILRRAHEEAYRASIEFWRQSFEDVFSGNGFDIQGWMKKIAGGFAAELMTAITGGSSAENILMNPGNFGGSLAQMFGVGGAGGAAGGAAGSGAGGAAGTAALGSYFFSSGTGGEAIQGPLTQSGQALNNAGVGRNTSMAIGDNSGKLAGAAGAAAAAYGYASLIDSMSKAGSGAKSNYVAGATAVGAVYGGIIGTAIPVIGTAIGAGVGAALGNIAGEASAGLFGIGESNKETAARKSAANEIEKIFDQVSAEGGIRFINEQGKVGLATNIVDQPFDHFNQFDAQRDLFGKYGQQSSQAFLGVGAGLAEQMGMGAQGGQLGVMLAESFQGSLEGLKAFVQAMGLTFEQLQDTLIKRGKMGQESWLAIVTEIQGAAAAFEEGISGTGKWEEALENLAKSAGTGQLALNQLKNIAIEAGEEGIKSVQQLEAQREAIIASGKMTAEEFDALILSLKQQGVVNLSDILKFDDLGLARIIAGMDANLQGMGKTWRDVSADVKAFQDAVNGLDGKTADVEINVTSNVDDTTRELMDRNLLPEDLSGSGTTSTTIPPAAALGNANTASTQALNPSNLRKATEGGYRAQGMQLNIDARGAGNGVAEQIVQSLSAIEDRIQTNTLDAVLRYVGA